MDIAEREFERAVQADADRFDRKFNCVMGWVVVALVIGYVVWVFS